MAKKIRIEKPKGMRQDETVKEWYERTTGQRIGSMQDQSTAVINGVTRQSNE